jgi:hypothetical protein
MSERENALLMIASIRAALTNGVKHYQRGRLLTDELQIISALEHGAIEVDESERVERTTAERELAVVRKEFTNARTMRSH